MPYFFLSRTITAFGISSLTVVAPLPSRVLSLVRPDSVPNITTDTGALAPGHRTFTRYGTPGLCVSAALNAADILRHSATGQQGLDSVLDVAPARDALPAGVVAVARACGAHMTVASTSVQDLPDLFTLALFEQNDSLARMTLQRRITSATDAAARDAIFLDAVGEYLSAKPPRVAAAETTLAQADALGPAAGVMQMAAHDSLLLFASGSFDTVLMQREAERMIALSHALPDRPVKSRYVEVAYETLSEIAYLNHPDSLPAIAQRAKQDLRRLPAYANATLAQVQDRLIPNELQQAHDKSRQPPPIEASYWFPKLLSAWPSDGNHVSVVVSGGMWTGSCIHEDESLLVPQRSDKDCGQITAHLRRWLAQYGSQGLQVIVATNTQGHAVRSVAVPPVEEAHILGWYFRDYLKLPVTVAISESAIQQLPVPDGRRWYTDTTHLAHLYGVTVFTPVLLLVGRDGKLLYAGNLLERDRVSPVADIVLAKAMRASPVTISHLPPSP